MFAKITVKIPVKKDTGTGVGKFCEIFKTVLSQKNYKRLF